jgi:hypothetical protein
VAGFVDGDDDVLDVIEHGLQLAGGALAQLARQVGRLVGHELHRANDAAALVVGARVRALDGSQQPGEIDLAIRPQRVLDLLVEQSMHRPSPKSRQIARMTAQAASHRRAMTAPQGVSHLAVLCESWLAVFEIETGSYVILPFLLHGRRVCARVL